MEEDRAAGAGDDRVVIVAQDDDDVIEVVVTPHFLVAGAKWKLDRAIVIGVIGGVAPAVLPVDGHTGKGFGRGSLQPVISQTQVACWAVRPPSRTLSSGQPARSIARAV